MPHWLDFLNGHLWLEVGWGKDGGE